jgi:hypothetical protein
MSDKLTIEAPSARCGHCGFTTSVAGGWSVEAGRLIFRAEPNPFPFRGPDEDWCGECGAELTGILLEQSLKDWHYDEIEAEILEIPRD